MEYGATVWSTKLQLLVVTCLIFGSSIPATFFQGGCVVAASERGVAPRPADLWRNNERGWQMKSLIVKRSLVIGGHKTSISLEDPFWNELKFIASEREIRLSKLVSSINASREHGNLSSALRVFVLRCYYRNDSERQPCVPGKRFASSGLKAPAT